MGTGKLLLGLLEALEKREQKLSKLFWKGQTFKLTVKGLSSRKVFPCSCSNKDKIYPGSAAQVDLGAFLGQCCHSSWEGKRVLLFFEEGLEGFRLRSISWGRELKSPLLAFAGLSSQTIFSPNFCCLITYIC